MYSKDVHNVVSKILTRTRSGMQAAFPSYADISLIVFDMAGTTVDDSIDGKPAVAVAMQAALWTHRGLAVSEDDINLIRGMDKRDGLRRLLIEASDGPIEDAEVESAYGIFRIELDKCLPRIDAEIAGTTATFRALRKHRVSVAVGSGFPQSVVDTLVAKLGWMDPHGEALVQSAFSSETLGRGRPDPIMIREAMHAAECVDPRTVVKVGDTAVDVEEANAAGCWSVAVLTGTQSRAQLEAASPDLILDSVADLLPAIGLASAAGPDLEVDSAFDLPLERSALLSLAFAGGERGVAAAKALLLAIGMRVDEEWLELQSDGQLPRCAECDGAPFMASHPMEDIACDMCGCSDGMGGHVYA